MQAAPTATRAEVGLAHPMSMAQGGRILAPSTFDYAAGRMAPSTFDYSAGFGKNGPPEAPFKSSPAPDIFSDPRWRSRDLSRADAVAAAVAATPGQMAGLSGGGSLRRTALLLGGLLLVVVGARWGAEVGTSHRLEELEARLQHVEQELRQRPPAAEAPSAAAAAAAACVTHVKRLEDGALQLLRADGSETGRVEAPAATSSTVHCGVAGVASAESCAAWAASGDGGAVGTSAAAASASKMEQGTGVAASRRAAAPSSPSLPQRAAAGGGAVASAAALPPAVAPAVAPQSQHNEDSEPQLRVSAAQIRVAQARGGALSYPDLTCKDVASREWLEIKRLAQLEFSLGSPLIKASQMASAGRARLQALVDKAENTIKAVRGLSFSPVDECSMGRLCMSLMALAAAPDDNSPAGIVPAGGGGAGSVLPALAMHSPLLTVLLDVPWRLVLASGWPLFGILAQLNLRRARHDDAPLSGQPAMYFMSLGAGLERHEAYSLASLGAEFLRSVEGRAHASTHVLPGLCALASQLLSPEVGTKGGMPTDTALKQVQGFYRQAVQGIEDVQGTLDTAWPLYRVLHLVSLTLELG